MLSVEVVKGMTVETSISIGIHDVTASFMVDQSSVHIPKSEKKTHVL